VRDERDFLGAAQELAALESLDIPALEVLHKLECSAAQFYDLLAARIGNDKAAGLLRRSGREELGHARRVSRALSIKLGRDYEPSAELREPYPIELPAIIDASSVLPALFEGELAGDADYQRWADAEPDPDVARLLRHNGREETLHSERVTQVIAILGSAG
jgi:rubrerythrin